MWWTPHHHHLFLLKSAVIVFLVLLVFHAFRSSSNRHQQQFLQDLARHDQPDDLSHEVCRSRFEYSLFKRGSGEALDNFQPSKYFRRRLRQYEKLHASCTAQLLRPNGSSSGKSPQKNCQYVVWVAPLGLQGLGNKMLAIASTFLYALLSNRVLLIARQENMDQIFCEPFPNSSWLLPEDLNPVAASLNDSVRLGHLRGGEVNCTHPDLTSFPPTAYAYLSVDYTAADRKFFCQGEQDALRDQVRWLFLRSNVYYVPGFHYVPSFSAELRKLFPQQQAIFHHLGRYLFNPINTIWDRTARYYRAYLADADFLVGIQMRVPGYLREVRKDLPAEVFRCAVEKEILPNTIPENQNTSSKSIHHKSGPRKIAAVVTSLDQRHFDVLRDMYLDHDTEDGALVAMHQPSHEGEQHTGNLGHDEKALMEMYLLSFSNVLITSPGSTFGYVAQGIGGLRPWLMWSGPGSGQPICSRVTSLDPCFFSIGDYNCDCSPTIRLKNLQRCEDAPIAPGMKLKPT